MNYIFFKKAAHGHTYLRTPFKRIAWISLTCLSGLVLGSMVLGAKDLMFGTNQVELSWEPKKNE